MSEITITLRHAEFTAPITNSKRSKLGKREITGGVAVNIGDIPENVVWQLLTDAITDFVQAGLKNLDQDKATQAECQAAMKARLALLKSGAMSAPGSARKAPTRDPIKAEAKKILKAALQAGSEEKIDGRVLVSAVSALFKQHAAWVKTKDEALEPVAKLVEDALAQARAQYEKQGAMSSALAAIVEKAKKEAGTKAAEARPTPTQRVAGEKKAGAAKPKAR